MMKRFGYIFGLLAVVLLVGMGCEKNITSLDESTITKYVDIELEGDAIVTIPSGTAYVEPGYVAIEGDEDVTDAVVIDGTVDHTTVGLYTVTYLALNGDGFPASKSRTVIVYDPDAPSTDLTGTWNGIRVGRSGGPITIEMVAPGIFYASDLFGGSYDVGFGYGSAYRLRSYIQVFADNTYIALQTNSPWGPWEVLSGTYDAGTNVMTHRVQQGTFGFDVVLTKI